MTRTAKALNQTQVANRKPLASRNGLMQATRPAGGLTSSAKKNLPQLKGTLTSGLGLGLLAEDRALKGGRSSMAIA